MTLIQRIDNELAEARRRGDGGAVSTLGLLKSEVLKATKEPGFGGSVSDELVVAAARREFKKHEESADAYAGAGRTESAEKERTAAALVLRYLPAQLGQGELDAELKAIIADVKPQGPAGFGQVMRAANARLAGRAQGAEISAAVKRLLA